MQKLCRIATLLLCFYCGIASAQNKMAEIPGWLKSSNTAAAMCFSMLQTNAPHNNSMLCIKTDAPHLPFFCNMENRFRNKFNIYLKLRAGTDEQYMNMIGSCKR